MKKHSSTKRILSTSAIATISALMLGHSAQAAISTWQGADGADWSTAANWNGGVPISTGTAIFNTGSGTVANALVSSPVQSITFDSNAGSYTIGSTSGNSLTLRSGGTTQIASGLTGTNITETINAPLSLGGAYTFANNSTGAGNTLVINGAITSTAGSGSTLTLTGTGAGAINGNVTKGSFNLTIAVTGGAWILAGVNTNTSTTVSSGTLSVGNNSALGTGNLTMTSGVLTSSTSGITISNGIVLTSGTFHAEAYDYSLSGVISGATGALTKTGAGKLTLTGTNTYSGATTINGGTLSVMLLNNGGSSSSIGNSANTASNLVLNGGTLQYAGAGSSTNRLFTIGSNGAALDASGSGAVQFTNTGTVAHSDTAVSRTLTLTGNNTGANTLASVIGDASATGTTSLTKSGSGKWVLTGTNTYTGVTTVSAGELTINGSLAAGSAVNVSSGATLSGSGTINGAVAGTSAIINGTNLTMGATTLHGTSFLSGANRASSVTVADGVTTLSGTTKSTSALSVSTEATLNANGTIDGNAAVSGLLQGNSTVTGNLLLTSGTLAPGNSAGITVVNGAFSMDANSKLVAEVAGTTAGGATGGYDQVQVSGNVALAGTLDLTTLSGLTMGNTITLIANTGNGTTTGFFSKIITSDSTYTITEASTTYTFAVGGAEYLLNYGDKTGADTAYNDVTLTVVPEPRTWAMLVSGFGALVGIQRMRRRIC